MDIQNPHDKFFKEVFSERETAIDFFKHTLPHEISRNINFRTLKQDTTSFIDEELKEYFSDIIYQFVYRNNIEIKLALLFEHKSYIPDYPHLQILKYLLKIWEKSIKEENKLMPVLPFIFYHGEKKWKIRQFSDYFLGLDEFLKMFIPVINYLITDLSDYSDEEIKNGIFEKVMTKISLLMMKNIHDEELLIKNFVDYLNVDSLYYKEEKGLKFLEAVIRYVFSNVEKIQIDEIQKKIENLSVSGGKFAMTIAEKLIEKGKLEGKHEGKIEGKLETAKNMKNDGLDYTLISKYTGLSIEEIESI